MKVGQNLSFIEIMETGLLRKNILKWVPTFEDIQNLTKTCKIINFYIKNDIIRKKMFWYKDERSVTMKVKDGFQNDLAVLSMNDIDFSPKECNLDILDTASNFNGEVVASSNCIFVKIENMIQYYRGEKDNLFFKMLVDAIDLNFQTRKNATILDFTSNSPDNSSMILYALCYMQHENIKRIKIQKSALMSDCSGNDIILDNIFEGFPNLNELVIFGNVTKNDYFKLLENEKILHYILKDLSKKNDPTIVLTSTYNTYQTFILYNHMFIKLAKKYNVKIKCNLINLLPLSNNKGSGFYSIERCPYFVPMGKHITSIANDIKSSRVFFNIMKNMQGLENLEMLIISLRFSDLKKGLQRMKIFDFDNLSLKNCKYLKRVILYFEGYKEKRNDLRIPIFYNNLKFLASLMPSCVERFDLINGFELTNEITETISKFMPNIKLLITYDVSYKDSTCLNAFKNLQAFISYDYYNIDIPKSVKFLAILQRVSLTDCVDESLNQKVLSTYSKRFKKSLQTTKGDYIFFNDILQWDIVISEPCAGLPGYFMAINRKCYKIYHEHLDKYLMKQFCEMDEGILSGFITDSDIHAFIQLLNAYFKNIKLKYIDRGFFCYKNSDNCFLNTGHDLKIENEIEFLTNEFPCRGVMNRENFKFYCISFGDLDDVIFGCEKDYLYIKNCTNHIQYKKYGDGNCYTLLENISFTKKTAEMMCREHSGTLPMINYDFENLVLNQLFREIGSPFWLGFSCPTKDPSTCKWSTNEMLKYARIDNLNLTKDNLCGYMENQNIWGADKCNTRKKVVCQIRNI
ncbi:C-type lectin domain and C-type lectin-like domain and C-type lectin fold domain-containing protein [Strongyloides ratti]|uniref:C-type lectin domain and C-type lectin-like domain and C-type lectin fold domain-containing protein n=1 Tax=Strongyloides ratti TaxID=34506 RepID=A0A090L3U6_STRRB|nr:C-type lectin domain and C-type lectin-like domain and C-type lectin fold domain-containing protein [Strongyloides ratti]CEF62757.1 C-type lectin domain and C-type lectin-like domain and C-type lectin fold domain-containing protein [Strongyloides ratti]